MLLEPLAPPLFHLFQALLLFRREILRNVAVGFRNHVANVAAGVAPNFFQLFTCFVDDRPDLGHLFVGQSELPAQTICHRLSREPALLSQ